MRLSNSVAFSCPTNLEDIRKFFDGRPILPGESAKLYDTLFSRLAEDAKPKDTIEWIFNKDVVDQTFEIERLRKICAAIILNAMVNRLINILSPQLDHKPVPVIKITFVKWPPDSESSGVPDVPPDEPANETPDEEQQVNYPRLARRYFAGNRSAIREVSALLAERDIELDLNSLMAEAYQDKLETLELINRMLATVEVRRERTLRNFDRRRVGLGTQVKQTIEGKKYDSGAEIRSADEGSTASHREDQRLGFKSEDAA